MTDIQLALPWGKDAPARAACRRREEELAERLRQRDRQLYRLRRDLGEARQLAESLRQDLAEITRERDELQRRLNKAGLRSVVQDGEVNPWRFGRRSVQ